MDQHLARILSDTYVQNLTDHSVEQIRAARAECRQAETQLSYLRRLVQGHHDVLNAELDRRSSGGDPEDVADLVAQLPAILADRGRSAGAGHTPEDPRPEELSGEFADRFEALTAKLPLERVVGASVAELDSTGDELGVLETEISASRRRVFDALDIIEGELLRRYREGAANADDLLSAVNHRPSGGGGL